METFNLEAQSRDITGKKISALREKGFIPGVLYGHHVSGKMVSIAEVPFIKVFQKAGESSLIDLVIDSQPPIKVLIYDIQKDPLTDKFSHIDFYQVDMTEKLTTEIPLKFIGESRAIKELGGILVKSVQELNVRCLPGDLVHEIEVNISSLATFEDVIKISDITLPKSIEVLDNKNNVIATITPPISEEDLKKLEEKPVEDVTAIKVEEKKKKKEEEK
ncbi:50S ribosomal protein L25 [Candidatus Uhrbacteria bacterium]|nr:50S ribosomal protein L25 [Candidatus Uhrbacteria bacterium]